MLDVGALLEDAENRGGMLEHVDELQEHNAQVWQKNNNKKYSIKPKEAVCTLTSSDVTCFLQMNARFEEIESQAAERISEMETQLMQTTKEMELLKVKRGSSASKSYFFLFLYILSFKTEL